MSWALASVAILACVLIVGWISYERSRPSARMVAVVGTLAALAALGRDAFAALPEVKPITAMTLVVGYALGPIPGFAVGAVGMLASNMWLGEGSYTPWQMVAWGLVGLSGAALGALSGRRVPRLGLALACALSAFGAKEIMNVYAWTFGASHSAAAFLAMAGSSLPFDLTDTVASFLFGLAFGPELARLLARTRTRTTVRWEPVVPIVLALVPASAAMHVATARAAGAGPVAYLEHAQNRDGGFGAEPGLRSNELYSAWAALGLAATGRNPTRVSGSGGHSVLDAIRAQGHTLQGAGDLERTIIALHACGVPAHLPGAGDLLARLLRYRSPDGSFGDLVNITSFAVLALRAGGRSPGDPIVRAAAGWLTAQQSDNGGFSYAGRGGAPDVDDTAAAVQAISAAGGSRSPLVTHAVAFLLGARNRDGGFPQQPGQESNAQSSAWAIQALVAAHRDPALAAGLGRSPLAYLRNLIEPDGSVRYSRSVVQTPVWVTAQALTALARRPLPIGPPPSRAVLSRPRRSELRPPATAHAAKRSSRHTHERHARATKARTLTAASLRALAQAGGMLIGIALEPIVG